MALRRGSAEARVLIEGEENVSKIVEDVKRKVATMADATRKNTEATKALREGWRMTATGISSVINLAQQAAQAAKAIGEHAREGARSLEVSARFTRLFAADLGGAEGVMGRLVEASRGAMDETSVKEYALQTRRMGMDIDQTATLLELAGKMSAETGQTYAEAADVMFKAIATGESGALKAIGIQIDLEKNIGAVARGWGVSAEAIDQSTRAQINYNEVAKQGMAALGEVDVSPVISNIDRVGAAYNNQISSMQEHLAQVVVGFMDLDSVLRGFQGRGVMANLTTAVSAIGSGLQEPLRWLGFAEMEMGDLDSAYGQLQRSLNEAAEAQGRSTDATRNATGAAAENAVGLTAQDRAVRTHEKALKDAVEATIRDREATLANTIAKAEYAQELGHLVLAEELFTQASQIATTTQDGEAEATRLATQAIVIKNRAMIELLETQLLMSEVELAMGTDPKLEGYLPISPGEIAQLRSRIDVLKTHLSQVMTPENLLVSPSGQPTRGRPTRGGAARDYAAERERLQLVERFQQAREYYEERARLEKEAAVEQRQEVDEAIRASQEKVKAQADAYKELMNAVTETSRQGLSDSISMMGQLGGEF